MLVLLACGAIELGWQRQLAEGGAGFHAWPPLALVEPGGTGALVCAIIASAIPLAGALSEAWQYVLLAAAAVTLLVLRRSIVLTLLAAGTIGAIAALLGAPIPH